MKIIKMTHSQNIRLAAYVVTAGFLSLSNLALAMQQLTEHDLSSVSGQSGIDMIISAPQANIDKYEFLYDSGAQAGGFNYTGINLRSMTANTNLEQSISIDVGTNAAGRAALLYSTELNNFRMGGVGNTGIFSYLAGDTVRDFGNWAFQGDMGMSLQVEGGMFNNASSTSKINIAINDATLFYRQNWWYHSDIALTDFDFNWQMDAAQIGMTSEGLRVAGTADFSIGFDGLYSFDSRQDMQTIHSGYKPAIFLGWGGTVKNAEVLIRPGGLWNTATNSGTNPANPISGRTAGINYSLKWDYEPNFAVRIGHASGDREWIEMADWRNLESPTGPVAGRKSYDIANLTVDALSAANDANGAGRLCWGHSSVQTSGSACPTGGTLLNVQPGTVQGYDAVVNRTNGAALVSVMRQGNIYAYANSFKAGADIPGYVTEQFDWALVYTLTNASSNIYMYPGGSESDVNGSNSRNAGAILDILYTAHSFGDWADGGKWTYGSHMMIADTAEGAMQGIGLMGLDVLLAADDMRVWIKNGNDASGGLDILSPRMRAHYKGTLGSAKIPRGTDITRVANLNYNFEGGFNFRLSPNTNTYVTKANAVNSTEDSFLSFSNALRLSCSEAAAAAGRLGCGAIVGFTTVGNGFGAGAGNTFASGQGSFIAVEEPGRAGVDLRFGDLSGDMAVVDGRMALSKLEPAVGNTPEKKAGLKIEQTMLLGTSSAARMNGALTGIVGVTGIGRPVTSNVSFGGSDVYSMAIPAGQIYSSMTITKQ